MTPDELGDAWDGGKLHLPLLVDLNGKPFGRANAGIDMTFDFGQLIAHAAKTRPLCAGTIIGSGTVSNKLDGGPGKPVVEGGAGYSCIAEIRMIETIETGAPQDAVPALRRHSADRDEGQDRAFDLRRDRADRDEISTGLEAVPMTAYGSLRLLALVGQLSGADRAQHLAIPYQHGAGRSACQGEHKRRSISPAIRRVWFRRSRSTAGC